MPSSSCKEKESNDVTLTSESLEKYCRLKENEPRKHNSVFDDLQIIPKNPIVKILRCAALWNQSCLCNVPNLLPWIISGNFANVLEISLQQIDDTLTKCVRKMLEVITAGKRAHAK